MLRHAKDLLESNNVLTGETIALVKTLIDAAIAIDNQTPQFPMYHSSQPWGAERSSIGKSPSSIAISPV